MANNSIFKTLAGILTRTADTVNEAGGRAYKLSPENALAQFAVTGCFNHTFYANAETQVEKVLELAMEADPVVVAKTAIYARESGHMKDMPAFLVAVLSVEGQAAVRAGLSASDR